MSGKNNNGGGDYAFPARGEQQQTGDYVKSVFSYHASHLNQPGLPGAISWLFFALFFLICWLICYLIGVLLCLTFILCIIGIVFFVIGLVCLIIAIICLIIGLIFLLIYLASNTGGNGGNTNQGNRSNA